MLAPAPGQLRARGRTPDRPHALPPGGDPADRPDARFTSLAAYRVRPRPRRLPDPPASPSIRPATATDPGLYDARDLPRLRWIPGAYDAWLDHVWPAAACTRPIRLRGTISHVDPATGELLRTIPTDDLPDQAIYKPCGNRRATACPGCAETYRRDAFQLIRAGLAGGKGIPETVAGHPAVFATFTAPSFGPVHARPVRLHTCTDRSALRLQGRTLPRPPRRRNLPARPPHWPASPGTARRPRLGQPLCPDCYDYPAHAVWNNAAGELWRRTKQDIERHLIQLADRRGIPLPVPADGLPAPGPRRARQGRRIPGPRRRPLPRPAPPRRHQTPTTPAASSRPRPA